MNTRAAALLACLAAPLVGCGVDIDEAGGLEDRDIIQPSESPPYSASDDDEQDNDNLLPLNQQDPLNPAY